MSFKTELDDIIVELNNYKSKDTNLFNKYVNDRLNKSLVSYYEDLKNSVEYLATSPSNKLQRDIIKLDKED